MKNNKKNKCELEKFYEKYAALLWILAFIIMALFHPKNADASEVYKNIWTCPEYKEMLLELGNEEFKARLYGEAEFDRVAECSLDDEHFRFLMEYNEEEAEAVDKAGKKSREPQSIKSIKSELQVESVFATPFENSVGLISQDESMALERFTSETGVVFSEVLLSEAWDLIVNDEGAFQDSDEVHRTPFGTLVQTKPGDQASWLGLIKKRSETARVIVDGQRFDASGFKLNKMSVLRLMRHAVERFYIKKGMSESDADKLALKIMTDGQEVEEMLGFDMICSGFNNKGDFLIKIRLGDIEMIVFY